MLPTGAIQEAIQLLPTLRTLIQKGLFGHQSCLLWGPKSSLCWCIQGVIVPFIAR